MRSAAASAWAEEKPGAGRVDVGGGETVVAHHHFGAIGGRDPQRRAQGHHLAAGVTGFQAGDVFRLGAEIGVGLGTHLFYSGQSG